MGGDMQAFALLLAAMAAFLVSTIQLSIVTRGLIWLVGAALLVGSGYLMLQATGMALDHVIPAIADAAQDPDKKSWLITVIHANLPMLRGYVGPLLDFFLLFGGVVALLALVSFTPGEGLESITRLLCWIVLGAVLGGVATLAAVAIGFGGYPERTAFFGRLDPDSVIDADTFRLGAAPVRLFGIDALETDQKCYAVGSTGMIARPCGDEATGLFASRTQGFLIVCERVPNESGGFERDKYGRVLATCKFAEGPEKGDDLATEMVEGGLAVATDDRYVPAQQRAQKRELGMWGTCTLTPVAWRNDLTAQKNLAKPVPEWQQEEVVNPAKCPPPVPATSAP